MPVGVTVAGSEDGAVVDEADDELVAVTVGLAVGSSLGVAVGVLE